MDYVASFKIPAGIDKPIAEKIMLQALKEARILAPIDTGNLRRSIKARVYDGEIIMYIDKYMYEVPYYDYVNTKIKNDGSPARGYGYWGKVIARAKAIVYANLREAVKRHIIKESEKITAAMAKVSTVDEAVRDSLMDDLQKARHKIQNKAAQFNLEMVTIESENNKRSAVFSAVGLDAVFKMIEVENAFFV